MTTAIWVTRRYEDTFQAPLTMPAELPPEMVVTEVESTTRIACAAA
jgi:hypothetical protein